MIFRIYNTKPTRLRYTIILFIIPKKQAKEFLYNTSITQLIPSSFLRESMEVAKSKLFRAPTFFNQLNS